VARLAARQPKFDAAFVAMLILTYITTTALTPDLNMYKE
jgi:hypothetical protein